VTGFAVVLLRVPKPDGEILQLTPVLVEFATAAVIVEDCPGFREVGLAETVTVTGRP
jgi:hypothetical protein